MNAREVIDLIRAMPPEEQQKVIRFLEEMKAARAGAGADEKSFAAAAQWAFNEHAELMRKLGR